MHKQTFFLVSDEVSATRLHKKYVSLFLPQDELSDSGMVLPSEELKHLTLNAGGKDMKPSRYECLRPERQTLRHHVSWWWDASLGSHCALCSAIDLHQILWKLLTLNVFPRARGQAVDLHEVPGPPDALPLQQYPGTPWGQAPKLTRGLGVWWGWLPSARLQLFFSLSLSLAPTSVKL